MEPRTGLAEYSDEEHNWADPEALAAEPPMFASQGWSWHGPPVSVTGPSWGGCLEIVDFHLRTGRYLLPDDEYEGAVLLLETSEELAPADYVYRVLMCMGERRLLQRFGAVIWARPVLGPDLGHTEPQQIVPFGGQITVDGANRQVSAVY